MSDEVKVRPRPRRHKRLPLARKFASELERMQDEPTAVETVGRHYDAKHLRQALAIFPPRVRQCVIGRLCRSMSDAELARTLALSVEDVQAMLARARPRVQAYTIYFNDDRYWTDPTTQAHGSAN